ncbi:hypothetical protein FACS1894158_02870 [Betaproteobacteria bacterium]|nr:hypothetical protein FACS1894158_02870 [Betaproteobacteria bacterium]
MFQSGIQVAGNSNQGRLRRQKVLTPVTRDTVTFHFIGTDVELVDYQDYH